MTPKSAAPDTADPVTARQTALRDLLFSDPDQSVYAVLDAALIPKLPQRLAALPEESACLYRGELKPDLQATAPYVVKLRADGELAPWLWGEGWGRSVGIYAVTTLGLEAVRRHFRGFLRVRDAQGNVLYFRYYDPRVLRVYLPTCQAGEISTVYGGISRYVCESESGTEALVFPHHRLKVRPETVRLRPAVAPGA